MYTIRINGNENNVNAFAKFRTAAGCTAPHERHGQNVFAYVTSTEAEEAINDIYNYIKESLESEGNDASSLEKGDSWVRYDGVEAYIG